MGKNKVRLGGSKGERWAKGQSSNSNPSKHKHRNAAKSKFFNHASTDGNSKLTSAALLRHDASQGIGRLTATDIDLGSEAGNDANEAVMEATAMTHKTFDTFASDWSGCTNLAFEKVIQKFKANNAGHKDMLAVLAAVTEIIKAEGGKETETEYFAALMTTLEVSTDDASLAAVVRLLSLVIKKVPHPVLISRFSQINTLLMATLSSHSQSANVSLLRGILGCLSVLLRVQPSSNWALPETAHTLSSLLSFTGHPKPKIRKAAQHSVVSIVRGSDPSMVPHPSASQAANYCITTITASSPQDNAVLYMLTMLREILPALPRSATKNSCETILKLLTLGSSILVSTGFSALHGMFAGRPNVSCLPADMNGQLVTALYDYKPGLNDTGPMVAWLATMQEGVINLGINSPDLVESHLPRFCTAATECWLSDRAEVVRAAGLAVKAVLGEVGRGVGKVVGSRVVEILAEGVKYQYSGAWQTVLGVLVIVVEVIGANHPDSLTQLLRSLAQLRGSQNFSFEAEVDLVVGKAIAVMGPKSVLSAVPLNITGDETDYEFKSSWLLPVLRDNIRHTQLAFFSEYFLPLAAKCLARSQKSGQEGDKIGQKTYEVITYQIWSLLPGFCNCPTDLATSFKMVARILGVQLGARKEIRLDILTSLRHLIARNLESEENKSELARYSKNFLPILFNLYTTVPAGAEEAGQRLASLETIKMYFMISDTELVNTMFDRAMEKFKTETLQFTRDAVLDLLRSMLPHIEESRISVLYKETIAKVNSKDHKEQKKAYRVLEELCKCPSDACKQFTVTTLPSLQIQLLSSLSSASPSSQAPRLRCLISLISSLEEPHVDFALSVIPEAVLSIRAVNSKARAAAFSLLIVVGEALQRWTPPDTSQDTVVRRYMSALLAGLAGNPGLIHCTVLAVSRIYFQFRDLFPSDLTDQILHNILMLMSSASREVAGAALSFVKVFVTSTPILNSTKYVANIVKALVEMPEDCKRHFRVKTKYLLERLVRKFGWDYVSSLVPKSELKMHKRLKNMRKELARRARKMSEDSGADEEDFVTKSRHKTMEEILADSSDEDDEMFEEEAASNKIKDKKKKKSSQTWIQEGSEGIVDLLSPTAAQAVSSTNPKTPKSDAEKAKKNNSGFKINSDGKLVINDDDSDEEQPKKRRLMTGLDSDSDEETFDTLVSNKKRKLSSEAGSMKSGKSVVSGKSTFSKYTTGGSGIHRDLKSEPGSEYRSKKGRGDVKRAGKADPYAYIPLSHKALNKRKAVKAKGQFSSVINAAKKGASKGNKARVKDVKHLMKKMKV